jgi:hypothetical protein
MVVGKHDPESAQDGRWYADAELGEVAFKEVAYEVAAPCEAGCFGWRQKSARETAAQLKLVQAVASGLIQGESCQVVISNAAGQRFGTLPKECRRGAAEYKKAAWCAVAICENAQTAKDIRGMLDLVENHESA